MADDASVVDDVLKDIAGSTATEEDRSERRRRSPDRDRERSSDRDRDRDRHSRHDRDRHSDRDRRRSPPRRSYDRYDDRRDRYRGDRGGGRPYERRDNYRGGGGGGGRYGGGGGRNDRGPPSEEKKEANLERDLRTVLGINLPIRAKEAELREFFSTAGEIQSVSLITDRNSGKSKGIGYIEYKEKASVAAAILLNNTKFMNQTVQVQATQAEKNYEDHNPTSTSTMDVGTMKLYVGGIHRRLRKRHLAELFECIGPVEEIELPLEDGVSKGYAFVNFKDPHDCQVALSEMKNYKLCGSELKIGLMSVKGPTATLNSMSESVGLGNPPAVAPAVTPEAAHAAAAAAAAMMSGAGGVGAGAAAAAAAAAAAGVGGPQPAVAATPFILLRNMFNPAEEKEEDFHLDIQEDVAEECEKFGKVLSCQAEKDSAGFVWLTFSKTEEAQAAVKALNQRWFAGKMITANHVARDTFLTKWPKQAGKVGDVGAPDTTVTAAVAAYGEGEGEGKDEDEGGKKEENGKAVDEPVVDEKTAAALAEME